MYNKQILMSVPLIALSLIFSPWSPASAQTGAAEEMEFLDAKAVVVGVDCDAGESLAKALRQNPDRRNFWFTGTCEETEDVVIARNRVRLRGVGDAVLIGGIVIDAALGVSLHDFAVRNSPGDGVFITNNSNAEVANLVMQELGQEGISVENSVVTIRDVTVDQAERIGILNIGGRVKLAGTISVVNSVIGLSASNGASFAMTEDDFVLDASDNSLGIVVQSASSWRLTQGQVTVNNSLSDGITIIAATFDHRAMRLEIANSGGNGLFVAENAFFGFTDSDSTIDISDSGLAGVLASNSGNVGLTGGTTITGSAGPGLFVNDASVQIGETVIRDNEGGDVFLTFAARMTFNPDNDIPGPIICEQPVFTQGERECEGDAPEGDGLRSRLISRPPIPEI